MCTFFIFSFGRRGGDTSRDVQGRDGVNYAASCRNHVVGAFEEGGVSVRQIELPEWLIVVI